MTRNPEHFYEPLYSRDVSEPRPSPKSRGVNLEERKRLFAGINAFVRKHGDSWLTSIPGERSVEMQCLPGSMIPAELEKLGYVLEPDGEGERILPHGIVQHFVAGADGEMVLRSEGDTRPISRTVTHAGIVTVKRYSFEIP